MRQSRATSLLKSVISTAAGFAISLAAQWAVLPILLGHPVPIEANLSFAAIMTVISIARGYVLERVFEMLGWRVRLSPFLQAVIAERIAHVEREGWSAEHDDQHAAGDLAHHGGCYAISAGCPSDVAPPPRWRWGRDWWKPAGFRRDLIKAAALIIAEGDKFDRSRKDKRRAF